MSRASLDIRDFSGGLVNKLDSNLIPDNASPDCSNVVSRVIGELETRSGQLTLNASGLSAPVQGLTAYYPGVVPTRYLVAVANGVAYYWDSAAEEFVTLKTGLSTTNPVMFAGTVNYLVGADGETPPWKWNGSVVSPLANAPSKGMMPILHKEKLFMVDADDPSNLVWADSFQPEQWAGVNYQYVREGDGDDITALLRYIGELFIFKRTCTYSLRGTSLDDFRLPGIDERIGCVGPRAVGQHGLYIYSVGDWGLYRFNGMKYDNLSARIIPKLWDGVNKEYLHKAVVQVWKDYVFFSLPYGNATYNNLQLVFDTTSEQGAFWPWYGVNATCYTEFNREQETLLYAGDKDGFVKQQDIGTTDDTAPIVGYWQGKQFDGGLSEYTKKAKRAYVALSPGSTAVPDLSLSLDNGAFANTEYRRGDGMVKEYRITTNSKWRYLTPRLDFTAHGKVRSVMVPIKRISNRPKVREVLP